MRKKLLCMLLASTMLCASGTTVYAAEQPAAQAQAEVTDASGDETDAAVAEEAETLETEEDLNGASSTTAGQGTIDLSSISMSANTANPGDTITITCKTANTARLHFYYVYHTKDGVEKKFQTHTGTWDAKSGNTSTYDSSTGVWTIKMTIPSDATAETWKLYAIQMLDTQTEAKYSYVRDASTKTSWPTADLSKWNITVGNGGGRQVPFYSIKDNGGTWNGNTYVLNGKTVTDAFFFDGSYTYYLQADGTPMADRLTYHPDGIHIIYLDVYGHEVFTNFQYSESVGYTCYFDSNGYLYKDQITFMNDHPYYLNANGKMEDGGWFQFANGQDYGCANWDGTLVNNGWGYDPYGRVVFYQWNGMVARGLISDGVYYYNMDETDGHYLGQFPVQ